jgi:hypothetical protein
MSDNLISKTVLLSNHNLELQQTRILYVAPTLEIHGKYNLLTCGISAGLGLSDPTNLEQN